MSRKRIPSVRLSRRGLLQGAAGVAAVSTFAKPAVVFAADDPALGTYPACCKGDELFIGITQPLSGPYSAAGKDTLLGNQLAIELINSGALAKKMPELSGVGVLGKKLVYGVADTETKPNPAVQAQTRFIKDKNAAMITGCFSSATAVALEQLAQQEKVVYMTGPSGSNDTTGKNCRRYGFRCQPSAYMASKALAPVLAKALGKDRKAAYLVADYTFGHTFFDSMDKFTRAVGWTTVSKQVFPIGESDFSSHLLNIANSGANVLVNLGAGGDLVASTQQAKQFGIFKKMKHVVPNVGPFMGKELGPDLMEGVYGAFDFWWTLRDQFPLAGYFVDEFEKRNKYKPDWSAHQGYMQIILWAVAVERAKSFYPPKVVKALENRQPVNTTLGSVFYRPEDHQLVRPVPIVVGKSKAQMKNPDDYWDVVDLVKGEDTLMPISETGCTLGPYT
jgi:branched-chain amino acid transport system substrate-binding protein